MFTRQVVRAAQKMNFAAIRPTRGGPWIEVIRPNVERTKYPFGLLMSGEETLRRLQGIRSDVKAILTSGYNEVEAIQRFTGKGLAGFIQKPYTASQLAEKIKTPSSHILALMAKFRLQLGMVRNRKTLRSSRIPERPPEALR